MPLRDHFRPPVSKMGSWEGFHGMWPGVIVQQLHQILPVEFAAEPRVRLGTFCEIDLCTFEHEEPQRAAYATSESAGGVATAAWAPPEPTLAIDMELADEYEYEVLVYDQERGRILVAAIEFVSPANKDRPRSWQAPCESHRSAAWRKKLTTEPCIDRSLMDSAAAGKRRGRESIAAMIYPAG